MAKQTVRVGVIGLGVMGNRLLEKMAVHPQMEVAAVCDTAMERVEAVQARLNGARGYTDWRELVQDAEIDLVYVAVPPKFHHPIVLGAFEAGKHVLCEKPLANSLTEARDMRDAAQAAGKVHAMNFPTYYKNVFAQIKQRVQRGDLGTLRRIEVTTRFPQWPRPWQQVPWLGEREQGGFVREVVPHYLHMIRALFGQAERVQSEIEYPADPKLCENSILAQMRLADGTQVLIDGFSGAAEREHVGLKLYGTEGTLALENWSVLRAGGVGEALSDVAVEERDAHVVLLDELVKAVGGEEADLIGFDIGYDIQAILDTLLERAGEGWVAPVHVVG